MTHIAPIISWNCMNALNDNESYRYCNYKLQTVSYTNVPQNGKLMIEHVLLWWTIRYIMYTELEFLSSTLIKMNIILHPLVHNFHIKVWPGADKFWSHKYWNMQISNTYLTCCRKLHKTSSPIWHSYKLLMHTFQRNFLGATFT